MSGREDGSNGRNEHGQKAARRLKIKLSQREEIQWQESVPGETETSRGRAKATPA
jgi:hypothetical protein